MFLELLAAFHQEFSKKILLVFFQEMLLWLRIEDSRPRKKNYSVKSRKYGYSSINFFKRSFWDYYRNFYYLDFIQKIVFGFHQEFLLDSIQNRPKLFLGICTGCPPRSCSEASRTSFWESSRSNFFTSSKISKFMLGISWSHRILFFQEFLLGTLQEFHLEIPLKFLLGSLL